ncbi:hypothetical protein [Bacillus cereus group sp. BfR-BA-01523]|nr:hypothetical protein [Bacillus cereus group sp. BfR-BA-01523]
MFKVFQSSIEEIIVHPEGTIDITYTEVMAECLCMVYIKSHQV